MATRPARKRATAKRKAAREKARAYRARMRAKGLKPVQFWLPDANSPEFIAEAHRTSVLLAQSPTEEEDQAFIEAISIWNEEQ
jgi:hypothetical protein